MGYLIGGAGEGPVKEQVASSGGEFDNLSNEELLALRDKTEKELTKWENYQMARKIQINSLYGALEINGLDTIVSTTLSPLH